MDSKKQRPMPDQLADGKNKSGLDEWNDRLENNLEPEQKGDVVADENARLYSEITGSGDQSDISKS